MGHFYRPLMGEIWFPFSEENNEDDHLFAFRKLVEITGTNDEYQSIQRLYRLLDALARFRASDKMIFEWDLGFARRLVSPLRNAVFSCPALVNQFNLLPLSTSQASSILATKLRRLSVGLSIIVMSADSWATTVPSSPSPSHSVLTCAPLSKNPTVCYTLTLGFGEGVVARY